MRLLIETLTKSTLEIDVPETETVASLKGRIYANTGLPVRSQRLFTTSAGGSRRRFLSNHTTLSQNAVRDGARLQVQPCQRGGDDDGAAALGCMACLAIFVVSCSLMGVSVSILKPLEYGVDFNQNIQEIDWDAYDQGRHYLGVSHKFKRWPRNWVWYNIETMESRTYDGLSCQLDVNVQYSIDPKHYKEIYAVYGRKYQEYAVKPIARSELRNVIAKYTAFELVSQRHVLADDMYETLKDELGKVNIIVQDLQLVSIDWPSELEDAITATAVAVEDVSKAESEYNIAVISAETEVQAARELSKEQIYAANATAQETIADGNAEAAFHTYYAEAEAAWMQYLISEGYHDTVTTTNEYISNNNTNGTNVTYYADDTTGTLTKAGTNFSIPQLLEYTWLKYAVRDPVAGKVLKVVKPAAIKEV